MSLIGELDLGDPPLPPSPPLPLLPLPYASPIVR